MTVVLSGAGGDELFGGYPTLLAARLAAAYRMIPSLIRRRLIRPAVEALPTSYRRMSFDFKARSFVAGADETPERAHLLYKEVYPAVARDRLLSREVREQIPRQDAFGVFEQHLEECAEPETINRLILLDLKVFLPDCVLYTTDIMTSAHSLECRAPLLDARMLDFALAVPWRMKLKGWTTKYLVRRAMRPLLPAACVAMPKRGFLVPVGPWLRGPLANFAREIVATSRTVDQVLNREEVERILTEHVNGTRDHTRRLSSLLSFLLWAD